MFSKLRWMTIVVLAVLLSTGPLAALDGARGDDAPGVLAWVIQPLEVVWAWISDASEGRCAGRTEVRLLSGEEEDELVQPPPTDEIAVIIEPGG